MTTVMAAEINGLDIGRPAKLTLPGRTYEGELRAVSHTRKVVHPGSTATITLWMAGGSALVETVDGTVPVELGDTPGP